MDEPEILYAWYMYSDLLIVEAARTGIFSGPGSWVRIWPPPNFFGGRFANFCGSPKAAVDELEIPYALYGCVDSVVVEAAWMGDLRLIRLLDLGSKLASALFFGGRFANFCGPIERPTKLCLRGGRGSTSCKGGLPHGAHTSSSKEK